ncbi:hypothetical protein PVBG_05798 [Plasmodium vivax Brazil I]|uniref:Variable surface protein n=1 Tax=Plasmodium vivax (strain Brazil I) TaxID=1033975 RepID=A0A0J9SYL8_PLAV1|nr:hypothetical protein PVBG_05798 [Plasmodium vivax Brazil I]
MKFKHDRTSNKSFNRLLTIQEYKEELDDLNLGGNLVDYKTSPNMNNEEDATSTYGYLKRRKPINLLSYKKDYEHRYYRKKGLAKLDCYCENKLFQRIDELYNLVDTRKKDKSSFSKALIKKYRMHICFTIFIYALGALIFISDIILYILGNKTNGSISSEVIKQLIKTVGDMLVYVFPTILSLVIIYISIKLLQYESLKAGRGKMNIKEYFKYCKEVFSLKK